MDIEREGLFDMVDTQDQNNEIEGQSRLVKCLAKYNRKERYWLIQNALGEPKKQLKLTKEFRDRLFGVIDIAIPCHAWWATDYHINWLFGALILDRYGPLTCELANPCSERKRDGEYLRLIQGNQEDFDLIIAFDRTIILIEAKVVGSWSNKQIDSKRQRLQDWEDLSDKVVPSAYKPLAVSDTQTPLNVFMVLASPNCPKKLSHVNDPEHHKWPSFVTVEDGKPFFLPLRLPTAPEKFLVPQRLSKNSEKTDDDIYDHWKQVLTNAPDPKCANKLVKFSGPPCGCGSPECADRSQ